MSSNSIETLKIKLKAATNVKIIREKDLCQARNRERSSGEEIANVKAETEFLKERLEDIKSQIGQTKHQISMIKICSTSETCKIETHISNVEEHRKGFQELFDKERNLLDIRIRAIRDKEVQEEETLRQKEKEIAERKEQEAMEAAAVEAECEVLERECAILKKRNNAIMLKLRRKLLEAENARRKLARMNNVNNNTINNTN